MIARHRILPFPFNPVRSFTAVACGLESITLKDPVMFDLQHAIDQSRKLHETLVMAKGAHVAGGDPAPIIADALARLPDVANAMGHFIDPIEPKDGHSTDCGGDVAHGTGCGSCTFCVDQTRFLDTNRPNWRDRLAMRAVEGAERVAAE